MSKIKLGEIADVTKLAGFEFTKYIKYNETGEIIALRALNLRNGKLDLSDIKRIDKSVSEGLVRSKLFVNDILLTYTGNGYGDCAIIEENDKFHLAPNICKLTPDPEKVDPYYLYLVIRDPSFRALMSNYITGSGQPTIPMKTIRILEVDLPELDIQKRISEIIKTLDDKIELNNRINENLEQQAQALFESWFIDFERYGGAIPDDWHFGTVSEVIEFHDSKRIPLSSRERAQLHKIYPYYGATSVMDYVDRYLFDGVYLLLGEDGTVVDAKGFPILQYVEGKFWVNNHAHILTGKKGFSVELLYLLFKLTNVASIVTGAVQPKISQASLNKVPIVVPSEKELKALDDIIQPLFSQIRNLRAENARLTSVRDTLLPKLMSGELDLSAFDL